MKKYFDIQEIVKYSHRIEVEVDETQEELFEQFSDEVENAIWNRSYESKEDIMDEFIVKFGEDKTTFIEDGSPNIEFEAE